MAWLLKSEKPKPPPENKPPQNPLCWLTDYKRVKDDKKLHSPNR
jgi:hypothetical protein